MLRIAFDTNLLVAALTSPRGASARILSAWRDGRLEIVASEATLREAEFVVGGRWLARIASPEAASALLDDLRTKTVRVEPQPVGGLRLKDPGDLRMVEAAIAGGARYVVTTDREFLSRRGHAGVEFVTPSEFLRLLPS